jgi:hypothetical protein
MFVMLMRSVASRVGNQSKIHYRLIVNSFDRLIEPKTNYFGSDRLQREQHPLKSPEFCIFSQCLKKITTSTQEGNVNFGTICKI